MNSSVVDNRLCLYYEEQLRKRIEDHYAFKQTYMSMQAYETFIDFRLHNEDYQEQWINVLNALIGNLVGKDILDVGCGDGGFVVAIKKYHNSVRARGCDVSNDNIEMAKLRGEKYGMGQEIFTISEDSHLNFSNESFDVVVMFDVLEHVSHIPEIITETARVLRKGGYFFSSTPNVLWPIESHLRLCFPHWMPEKLRNIYIQKKRGDKGVELVKGINFLRPSDLQTLNANHFSQCLLNDEIFLKKIQSIGTRGDSFLKAMVKKSVCFPPVWFFFRLILKNLWPSIYVLARK